MLRSVLRCLPLLGLASSAGALRLERDGAAAALADDPATMPRPSSKKLPDYFEAWLPSTYQNMSWLEKKEVINRVERWHNISEDLKNGEQCSYPMPGEKVVYFVQHGDFVAQAKNDAPLWKLGMIQAQNVRWDPLMSKALSLDPKQRAQVVIASAAQKTLQTAVRALGDVLPDARWEISQSASGMNPEEGSPKPRLGAKALSELASVQLFSTPATNLLSQFNSLPAGWESSAKSVKERGSDLVDDLAARPEERFVVVTHGGMIEQADTTKTSHGEVVIRALKPDKTWRRLSPPDCWPKDA